MVIGKYSDEWRLGKYREIECNAFVMMRWLEEERP